MFEIGAFHCRASQNNIHRIRDTPHIILFALLELHPISNVLDVPFNKCML
jgi:hypothetical protein